jgi:putative FmdB family regulatory protein
MPVYEYKCKKCEAIFEAEQKMADDPYKIHNDVADKDSHDCGGDLVKVFSSIGIVWKGSGFYKTDTRYSANSKSNTKVNSSDGDKSSTKESKTSDKSSAKSTNKDSGSASKPSKSSDS